MTKDAFQRFAKARSDRARYEPMFDDAMRLTMPGRRRFSGDGSDGAQDIYDETGANGVSEFVSRIQAGMMPSFTEFIHLEAGADIDPKDRAAVNRDLDEIGAFLFDEIWASNFPQETSELLYDVAISTGTMLVEEGPGTQALVHRALPITDTYLERGPDDRVGGVFRHSERLAGHLPQLYPRARFSPKIQGIIAREPDKPLKVLDYMQTLPRGPGGEERCRYRVMIEGEEELVDDTMEGDGCSPFISARWQTTAGEVWGRGPLLNALGAIRTTNLMVQLVLENAAMSIVGVFQSDNDATIMTDNLSLVPGMILSKEAGTDGLEQVRLGGNQFNMQDILLQDQRLNIKKALFNDMLSDPNKTPATATEVVERMADLAHRTSAGFGRMYFELMVPYVRRALYLLEKRGDITMPVKGGRRLAYRAISPIAQAQEARQMQSLVQDFQIRSMLLGPQAAMASYEMKPLLSWLENRTGLDRNLYAKPEKIVAAMQAQSDAMMQQQLMLAQMGQKPA